MAESVSINVSALLEYNLAGYGLDVDDKIVTAG